MSTSEVFGGIGILLVHLSAPALVVAPIKMFASKTTTAVLEVTAGLSVSAAVALVVAWPRAVAWTGAIAISWWWRTIVITAWWISRCRSGISSSNSSVFGKGAGEQRAQIKEQLNENYWKLDPYLRARSHYDRTGVLGQGGKLDFYPQTSASATHDDLD